MKKIIGFGAGLALAVFLTSAANAQIVYYNWVPAAGSPASSGLLELTGGLLTSLQFTEPDGVYNTGTGSVFTPISGTGVYYVSGDSDVTLWGTLTGGSPTLTFEGNNGGLSPTSTIQPEQQVADTFAVGGDWVPVPEPSTLIAGAMLLLPFGASTMRIMRRKVAA
jgi:hypothetical protein